MKFWSCVVLAASLLVSMPAPAAVPPITIGDVAIRLPADAALVSLKARAPDAVERLQALVKQDVRIDDALATDEDVERMRAGLEFRGVLYVYAHIPSFDAVRIDDRDWDYGRRVLAKAIAGLDLDEESKEVEDRLSADASARAEADVRIELGQIGKPVVFGDDPQAVKFSLALPIETTVVGETQQRLLGAECAIVRLKQKLVVLYVYRERTDEQSARELRAELERTIERLRAANA